MLEQELLGIKYFHGTGYLTYDFGESKYAGGEVRGVRHSLRSILQEGIRPFPDFLNEHSTATTSVTEDPIYAVLYALLHSEQGTSYKFGIERGKEWVRVLWKIRWRLSLAIIRRLRPFSRKRYSIHDQPRAGSESLRHWAKSFNNRDYFDKFFGGFRGMIWGESNIKGNFPVILGIKELRTVKEMPGWNEVRTPDPILPEQIGIIFVPRDKMDCLPEGMQIPIYPLEDFIDLIKLNKEDPETSSGGQTQLITNNS